MPSHFIVPLIVAPRIPFYPRNALRKYIPVIHSKYRGEEMGVGLYTHMHTSTHTHLTSIFKDIVILRKCNSQLLQAYSCSEFPFLDFFLQLTVPTLTMQYVLLSVHIISPQFIPPWHLFLFSEKKKKKKSTKSQHVLTSIFVKRVKNCVEGRIGKIWLGLGKINTECGKMLSKTFANLHH